MKKKNYKIPEKNRRTFSPAIGSNRLGACFAGAFDTNSFFPARTADSPYRDSYLCTIDRNCTIRILYHTIPAASAAGCIPDDTAPSVHWSLLYTGKRSPENVWSI